MKKPELITILTAFSIIFTSCGIPTREEEVFPDVQTEAYAELSHPMERMKLNDGDLPEYANKGIYDGEFIEISPDNRGAPETYDELMADISENQRIDSFYKIEITDVLEGAEAEKLNGWSKGKGDHNCVFYKGVIAYDYFENTEMNDEIIFRMPGTIPVQREHNPPYSAGDIIAVVTQKKEDDSDITRLFKSYAFLYDIISVNGAEYAFVRGQNVGKIEDELENYISGTEISAVTTASRNPVLYYGAYAPEDIADSLLKLWR